MSRAKIKKEQPSVSHSQLLTIVLFLCLMLFIVSGSIAVPIVCRPFFYAHIRALHLTEVEIPLESGTRTLSEEEIRQAYNEMLDYCLGISDEFSTGVLSYTESGKDHFTDCRRLFLLDLWVCGISGAILAGWGIVRHFVSVRTCRWKGRIVGFWSGLVLLIFFALIVLLGSVDFDRTFEIFHMIFFPGKTNWVFDYRYDQIINILPETFFRNCAILIVSLLLVSCVVLVTACRRKQTA